MRRALAWIAVVAQLAVLAFMAGEREWVARSGQTVLLRTAPVDPNDPMRGDYVRLDYEIAHVPIELCRDAVATWFEEGTIYSREKHDARVYAALRVDEFGLAELVSLSDQPPAGGLYLRGRVDSFNGATISVRYGVEAFFMEQGAAREFENLARGEKAGVPVNAHVAVSSSGLAVLRDYEWEPLGIQINLLRRDPPSGLNEEERRAFRRTLLGAEVILKNHSSEPVAIVDLPQGRSFRLMRADRWGRGYYAPVKRSAPPAPVAANVIVLPPNLSYQVRLDFTRPEWFVIKDAVEGVAPTGPVSLESLADEFGSWFRVEYVPPTKDACAGLPNAELIRHRRLRSRGFNPAGGGVD
jgi:uncharacterized membrane-anchored protein